MLDMASLLYDLARDRPVFHSEADFQHALALRLHDVIPDGRVHLEYKPFLDERIYLDIWLPGVGLAVELKYRTKKLKFVHDGEFFALRDQGAHDISRYDFLKDVQRLERLHERTDARAGLAVLLTNDRSYWRPPVRPTVVDAAFRLHEGRTVEGTMAWSERASVGTTKHREQPIRLDGSYVLHWQDYVDVGDGSRFRYLVVETSR